MEPVSAADREAAAPGLAPRQRVAHPARAVAAGDDLGCVAPAKSTVTASAMAMGTVVTVRVIGAEGDVGAHARVQRALGWFAHVEGHCSRFDPVSELTLLCRTVDRPVVVSDLLFGLLDLALELARRSRGAFDPTVGLALERAGFNRHHLTGEPIQAPIAGDYRPTYRDVLLDTRHRSVTLRCPLVLDLGAVAKGLAIDLAARELHGYSGYAVEAGGDLYLGGLNEHAAPWSVGIRHPRRADALIDMLVLSDVAVCTSGDYERRVDAGPVTHHLLDPRAGHSATGAISATVVAPSAMLADGLSTTAFVLGPRRGLPLLERAGVEGMIVTPRMHRKETAHYAQYRAAAAGI